jgi:uncharacterized protein (DUF362 family)
MGWADDRSAFGKILRPGSKVVIKPNLVPHENEGRGTLLPLITHPYLIQAVVTEVLRGDPATVLVGDAPIQKCDFKALLHSTGLGAWAEDLQERDKRFKGIEDLRRTTCAGVLGVRVDRENFRPEDEFVRFDLAEDSLLEPVSEKDACFRVGDYDPSLLARTHAKRKHQFLISRQIIDADLVINLPKLKTHKKAGITCALKNLVGINGNKEYLPHHRVGGSDAGGDCYPGRNRTKRFLEYALDRQVVASSYGKAALWRVSVTGVRIICRLQGDKIDVGGSWSGNDTIWRTCLDLNRILLYGKSDGGMSDGLRRSVLHIADAIVAGQGDGPLAPDPLKMSLIIASRNAAAMDWVSAHLLQYDVEKVPIVRHAFDEFKYRIAAFTPANIQLVGDLECASPEEMKCHVNGRVCHPFGWRDAAVGSPLPHIALRTLSASPGD